MRLHNAENSYPALLVSVDYVGVDTFIASKVNESDSFEKKTHKLRNLNDISANRTP